LPPPPAPWGCCSPPRRQRGRGAVAGRQSRRGCRGHRGWCPCCPRRSIAGKSRAAPVSSSLRASTGSPTPPGRAQDVAAAGPQPTDPPGVPPAPCAQAREVKTRTGFNNFDFSFEALTAAMRALQVTDKPIVKKAQPWTLPPSTVAVVPRSPDLFWEGVRKYAAEAGNWDLVERLSPYSTTPACPKSAEKAA
ncbi:unnamed protein product, partial [Bubo scandiacus]